MLPYPLVCSCEIVLLLVIFHMYLLSSDYLIPFYLITSPVSVSGENNIKIHSIQQFSYPIPCFLSIKFTQTPSSEQILCF
jgi:hypothetical protein